MTPSQLTLRSTVIVAVQQIALAAVLFVLIAGWLHIPDANAFEVFLSVVLAVLIAAVAGVGESAIALRLTGRSVSLRSLVPGTVAVILTAVLWYAISLGVDHLGEKTGLWAGYLNSRLPASLRNFFSYEHLYRWWSWLGSLVCWMAAGLLAATAFVYATCNAPAAGFFAILRSRTYWLSVLLFAVVEGVFTGMLLGWTPGHGLGIEAFSLIVRLALVVILNAAAIALLFQAMARAVVGVQSVGMGEPATSQPRTVEMP